MADPQDPTNSPPDGAGTPPEKKPPAKAAKKTAKAPAKKAPAKNTEPAPPKPPEQPSEQPVNVQQRVESNGDLTAAAKDAAAQAKSTVEAANNPVSPAVAGPAASQSPLPVIVALAVSLLAILLIRQLRRR